MDTLITECPHCGSDVVKRLGRWECSACEFIAEPARKAAAPEARSKPQSYKDPRSDRHNLSDLLSGVVRSDSETQRATRRRR